MNDLDLLSDAQVEKLTGAKQPAAQMKILREHGIFYVKRPSDGRPSVTLYAVHHPSGFTDRHSGSIHMEAVP